MGFMQPCRKKHFGIRMKLRLLKLFNSCLHESNWPSNSSRAIFIKKPGKSNYASSSSYRPLTLSKNVGKNFEKMINTRLRTFFTSCEINVEEQEGFREKRSTVWSLYRMHIEFEDIQRNKKPAVLLNMDLEKAFDSVWIDGLLYKLQNIGIAGRLLGIIQAFLSNVQIIFHKVWKLSFHLILTADDILQLANQTQASADDLKRWWDRWRMAINGSKTE